MKVALMPLIKTPDQMSYTMKVCMVSGMEFEKDMKKNLVCFSIIPRGPSFSSGDQLLEASVN